MKLKFLFVVYLTLSQSAFAGNWFTCHDSTKAQGFIVGIKTSLETLEVIDKQSEILRAMFNQCDNDGNIISCLPTDFSREYPFGFEIEVKLNGTTPTSASLWFNGNPQFKGRELLEKDIPCGPESI